MKIWKAVTSKIKYLTLLAVIRLHRKNGVLKVNTHTHIQSRPFPVTFGYPFQ